jgi:hypothetical protein
LLKRTFQAAERRREARSRTLIEGLQRQVSKREREGERE